MVSQRRAARAGLGQPQHADAEPPEWFWHCDWQAWRTGDPIPPEYDTNDFDRFVWALGEALRRWSEGRDAWLAVRGLVAWPMHGLTRREWERIQQEEPHRVLHRPPP
ncbi:hypothetical protein [Streptomyces sp. T028]|uniref:hypothetical protein n=1 Tax=Streptomyces sp. T028 TaxID=3394379 RepID=UPI003A88FB67